MNWKELFEIKEETDLYVDLAWNSPNRTPYHLVNKLSGEVVAKYKDHVYAVKQAKRKYRRLIKKTEKIILE
jgi:hypothetical protein